jgi:hypothetical protein
VIKITKEDVEPLVVPAKHFIETIKQLINEKKI